MSEPGAAVEPSLGSAVMRTVTSSLGRGDAASSMGKTTTLLELTGSCARSRSQPSSNRPALRSSPVAFASTFTTRLKTVLENASSSMPVHVTRFVSSS